jgi:hypothetical protein
LLPETAVYFGSDAVVIRNFQNDSFLVVDGRYEWEKQLVLDLHHGWMTTSQVLEKYAKEKDVPASHLEQFIQLLANVETLLVAPTDTEETTVGSEPLSSLPHIAILDSLSLYEDKTFVQLFSDHFYHFKLSAEVSLEQIVASHELAVMISNEKEEQLRVANLGWRLNKPIIHCGIFGSTVHVGPITSRNVLGCFGCFTLLAKEVGLIDQATAAMGTIFTDQASRIFLAGLIDVQVRKFLAKPNEPSFIRCFSGSKGADQSVLIGKMKRCPVCG